MTKRTDGETEPKPRKKAKAARILQGLPAAPGVAIGRALVIQSDSTQIFQRTIAEEDVAEEIARLESAVEQTREQITILKDKLHATAGEQYSLIFDAHLMFLQDPRLVGDAVKTIRREKVNAEWALFRASRAIEKFLSEIDDAYLRERAHDVADVHARIQRNLSGASGHLDLSDLDHDVVIVAHSLPPSEAVALHHEHVVGLVTEVGGKTSHTAIVAKSMAVPAVVGVKDAVGEIRPGSLIAVDGRQGKVLVSPNEEAVRRFARRRQVYQSREERLIANRDLPAVTRDGVRVVLRANIELLEELESAQEHGAEGIGLYRSEFLFLAKTPHMPTEEDHYETYERLVKSCAPQPVTIRTLDLGGEKYFHDVLGPGEANPILGLRAIRFCLTKPEIIETQLRAILRAAVHGPTRVMFPLVSCMEELTIIRELLARVRRQLEERGDDFAAEIPVGIMVEVPSAATLADLMARKVDFFAIGTNDLIQYTLAVDRGNEHVSHLFQPLHPAVLRLLQHTARSAKEAGIGVSLCGEMAANPVYAGILVGMGIEELSMDPVSIPAVKEAIRSYSARELRQLVRDAMKLESAERIEALAQERVSRMLDAAEGPVRPRRLVHERQASS